jgi:AcrR family transcriptional regulator
LKLDNETNGIIYKYVLTYKLHMGRNKTVTDQELLRHARDVFLAQGRAGSTKEIARRAGISEAVLFQRFRTKRDLALAALHPTPFSPNEILHLDSLPKDFRTALTQLGHRMFSLFHHQIPAAMHLITSFGVSPSEIFVKHSVMGSLSGLADVIARFLIGADSQGKISAPNPQAVAGLFIGAIHSLAIFDFMGMSGHRHSSKHKDAAIDSFVAVLWKGLAPKKPRKGGNK